MVIEYNNSRAARYLGGLHRGIAALLATERQHTNPLEERLFLMCVYLAYKLNLYEKGKTRFVNVMLYSCPPVGRGTFAARKTAKILSCCGVSAPADVIYMHYELGHGPVDRTKCFLCKKRKASGAHVQCVEPRSDRVDRAFVQKMREFRRMLIEQDLTMGKAVTTKSEKRLLVSRDTPPKWSLWWELKAKATNAGVAFKFENCEEWVAGFTELPIEYKLKSPSMSKRLGTPWHEPSACSPRVAARKQESATSPHITTARVEQKWPQDVPTIGIRIDTTACAAAPTMPHQNSAEWTTTDAGSSLTFQVQPLVGPAVATAVTPSSPPIAEEVHVFSSITTRSVTDSPTPTAPEAMSGPKVLSPLIAAGAVGVGESVTVEDIVIEQQNASIAPAVSPCLLAPEWFNTTETDVDEMPVPGVTMESLLSDIEALDSPIPDMFEIPDVYEILDCPPASTAATTTMTATLTAATSTYGETALGVPTSVVPGDVGKTPSATMEEDVVMDKNLSLVDSPMIDSTVTVTEDRILVDLANHLYTTMDFTTFRETLVKAIRLTPPARSPLSPVLLSLLKSSSRYDVARQSLRFANQPLSNHDEQMKCEMATTSQQILNLLLPWFHRIFD